MYFFCLFCFLFFVFFFPSQIIEESGYYGIIVLYHMSFKNLAIFEVAGVLFVGRLDESNHYISTCSYF